MTKSGSAATSLCLVFALLTGLLAPAVRASDDERERTSLLSVVPRTAAPIGTVESFGRVLIDGQVAQGRAVIWGGELIQAPTEMNVRVELNDIGQVTLTRGSAARFATASIAALHGAPRRVLIASLVRGEVKIELSLATSGYAEAGKQAFVAAAGASFRLGLSDGNAAVTIIRGELSAAPLLLIGDYLMSNGRPNVNANLQPGGNLPPNQSIRQASKKIGKLPVTVQRRKPAEPSVHKLFGPAVLETLAEEPARQGLEWAASVPVTFRLSDQQLGSLSETRDSTPGQSITVLTNSQGYAEVFFHANPGRFKGKYIVEACDPTEPHNKEKCSEDSFDLEIAPIFPVYLLIGLAAVGVTVGTTVIIKTRKEPIKAIPPPIIK